MFSKKPIINPKIKKLVSLFLVFSIVSLTVNLYAKEKRGAELILQKKDGTQIKGELITIKTNTLLLLDSETKTDKSIMINNIKVITVLKKSKVWTGAALGGLAGAGAGVITGFISGDDEYNPYQTLNWTAEQKAIIGGILYGFVGALGGMLIFTIFHEISGKETIQLEGKSPEEINEALNKLRKKARIPDYN